VPPLRQFGLPGLRCVMGLILYVLKSSWCSGSLLRSAPPICHALGGSANRE
jgi:hypothetical protein